MESDWFLVGLVASAAASAGTAAGAIGTAVGSALTGAGGAGAAGAAGSAAVPAAAATGPALGALAPGVTAGLSTAPAPLLAAGGAGPGAVMAGAGPGILGGTPAGGVAGGLPATAGGIAGSAGPSAGGLAPSAPAAHVEPPAPTGGKAILAKLFGKEPGAQAPTTAPVSQAGAPAAPTGPSSPASTPAGSSSTLPIFQGKAGTVLQNLIKARTTIADPLAPGSPLAQFTKGISPQNRALLAYALKRTRNPDDHISALGNLYARF